jgi:hypothetical protein
MSAWEKIVVDLRALAKVIESDGAISGAALQTFADALDAVADDVERAVADAGEGLALLAGPKPRAILVLSDAANELMVQMAFDPPIDADAPKPHSYDAAISFLAWLRERLIVAIEGGG